MNNAGKSPQNIMSNKCAKIVLVVVVSQMNPFLSLWCVIPCWFGAFIREEYNKYQQNQNTLNLIPKLTLFFGIVSQY